MRIDVDKLTFRELLDVEEKAGLEIGKVIESGSMRGMAALVWVVRRREDPQFSWDDALDLPLEATDAIFDRAASNGLGMSEDDAVDPTGPADDANIST